MNCRHYVGTMVNVDAVFFNAFEDLKEWMDSDVSLLKLMLNTF